MIKLLNIDESIPSEFFVFINFRNLITKHNIETNGSIFSAAFPYLEIKPDFLAKYLSGKVDYLPFTVNNNKDLGVVSHFANNITSDYRTEYNAEMKRFFDFPLYPSRLSAIYAFGDYTTCEAVSKKYNWDLSTVRRFTLVPHDLNRVVKVNMEIISLERYANGISMISPESNDLIWNSYWSGHGNIQMELPTLSGRKIFDSGIINEYLIEGVLQVITP